MWHGGKHISDHAACGLLKHALTPTTGLRRRKRRQSPQPRQEIWLGTESFQKGTHYSILPAYTIDGYMETVLPMENCGIHRLEVGFPY